MGVFDDDRDLGEHRLETDVEVLDLIRGEVVVLEHLDGILGHPVGFQGQESLGSLCRICSGIMINLFQNETIIYQISNKQTLQLMFDKRTETPTTEETESYQTDLTDTIQHVDDQH